MSLNKYKWLVNSAIHKKGDIVEMPEEDAKIRLILKHCVIYTEGEREEKRVVEVDKVHSEVMDYFKEFISWKKAEMGVDAICFHKKDKKKVLKILPDLLDKGYVVDGEIIKSIKANNTWITKLYFV